MSVKQISKIIIKKGLEENLPLSLSEGEFGYTTDTGGVYIGAPNLEKIAYRAGSGSTNDAIFPYQNVKLITEFDLVRTITGDYYIQGPLETGIVSISSTPANVYTFDKNINSISASFSLYDGTNVNMVGEMFISLYGSTPNVCVIGQISEEITFSATLNSNKQIVLQAINNTSSQYTFYINARCWTSDTATWTGTKGSGISPECSTFKPYLSNLKDVSISNPLDKQILVYNGTTSKWTNETNTFVSSNIDSSTDYQISVVGVEKDNDYLWVTGSMSSKIFFPSLSSYNTLSTNLTNEIARAKSAEHTLQTSINTLSTNLTNEITRAKSVENTLSSNITIVSNNLLSEVNRAKEEEAILAAGISQNASNLNSEILRAKAVEANKEDLLGFTPVQQGTGILQHSNTIKLGYDGTALRLTVDNTDFGEIATENWVTNKNYASETELEEKTTSTYITDNVEISSNSNNLLTKASDGLLVQLAGTQTSFYVSSSTGSDSNTGASASSPLKTIRAAINSIAAGTSANIYLKAGDTFRPEDGSSMTIPDTYSKTISSNISISNKNITFVPYDSSKITAYDNAWNGQPGYVPIVDIGDERPVIEFTFFNTTDTVSRLMCCFFHITGTSNVEFQLIKLSFVDNTGKTSLTKPVSWCAIRSDSSGMVLFLGCYFKLCYITPFNGVFGAPYYFDNYCYFDTSSGSGFLCVDNVTLTAAYSDTQAFQLTDPNGNTISGLMSTAGNFNSTVANSNSISTLVVINSAARIYQGIKTQNKLDN